MRYALALIVIFAGWQIGKSAIDQMQSITDQRNSQLCQVDPSYCNK